MSSQHTFEEQGKVQPKPEHEEATRDKVEGPVTVSEMGGKLSPDTIKRMQQTVGNAAVQRFLAQRTAEGTSEVDDATQASINAKRGSGQALDEGIATKAGAAMGHDFSDVNVHTDSQSDQLNKQIGAKAFTTGSDVFFSEGAYNPGSDDGQRLVSHELTHVVQQSGNSSPGEGKMSVNDPNDQHEGEADSAADSVMNMSQEDVAQRQEEEMMPKLQAQDEEEMAMKLQAQDDEEMAMKLQAQDDEEMMPKLQAQVEEEEMAQPKLQAQVEEEEMAQPKLQAQDDEEMMPKLQAQDDEEMMPKLQAQDDEEMAMKLQAQDDEELAMKPKLQMQDELPDEEL